MNLQSFLDITRIKISNFTLFKGKMPKMGLAQTPLCSFCKKNDEALIHLFARCPVTKLICGIDSKCGLVRQSICQT